MRTRLGDVYRSVPATGFLATHRNLLLELREGTATFDEVARKIRPAIERRASFFERKWARSQDLLSFDDLVQEMLFETWRAVDRWDFTKSRDIARFVDVQLVQHANREVRRAAGWPDPRRTDVATRVGGDVIDMVSSAGDSSIGRELTGAMAEPATQDIDTERARMASRALARLPIGLMRHVVELVLSGESIEDAAGSIYEDPALRIEYRFACLADARRAVRTVAAKATSTLATV